MLNHYLYLSCNKRDQNPYKYHILSYQMADLSLIQCCSTFSKQYCDPISFLYIVFGHSKSGKSVFVDLLTGKKLVQMQDPEFSTTILVQDSNREHEYPPIYLSKSKDKKQLAFEGFSLDLNEESPIEVMKLPFLQALISNATRVSLIILAEDAQKESIPQFIEFFLSCMGITNSGKDQRFSLLTPYMHLILTKTQEGQFQQSKDMLPDIIQSCQNQSVKEVMTHLLSNNHINEFPMRAPTKQSIDILKKNLQPLPFNISQFSDLLDSSILRQRKQPFTQDQQNEVIQQFQNLSKMITALILFSCGQEKTSQREYENQAKKLFPTSKKKNQITFMVGKWTKAQLLSLSSVSKLLALENNNNFQIYILALLEVVKSFEQTCEISLEVREIRGRVVYFNCLSHWLSKNLLKTKLKGVIESFKKAISRALQPIPKAQPKGKSMLKIPVKKSTAFSSFKQGFQTCKSNEEAIHTCINIISSRQTQQKYDHYQVIFHFRLLRDLLQQYNNQHPHQAYFLKQLLQLSLYTGSYYDFDNYLSQALIWKTLNDKDAIALMKTLNGLGKYQSCERVIDYLMGEGVDYEGFKKLAQMKVNIKEKINEYWGNEHRGKEAVGEAGKEGRKQNLSFTAEQLLGRTMDTDLSTFLRSSSFRKYISSKEE